MTPLAAFLWRNDWSICGNRQHVSAAMMGPFIAFSSMSLEQHWAHMTSLAVFL
jgi:hypothetical protein